MTTIRVQRLLRLSAPCRTQNLTTSRCLTLAMIAGITLLGGCGTTREFAVHSKPQGALIMSHMVENVEEPQLVDYLGETPGTSRELFLGDTHARYLTLEKRGFQQATLRISSASPVDLSFELEPIEDLEATEAVYPDLDSSTFSLIGVDIEVAYRTGAGAIGDIKPCAEDSQKASETMRRLIVDQIVAVNPRIDPGPALLPAISDAWRAAAAPVIDYLHGLDQRRLAYYGRPPRITDHVRDFATVLNQVPPPSTQGEHYLLYIWGKTVTETKGRKFANMALSVLGGAATAANPATVYDPAVFASSSGTLIMLYVIDPTSSEVVAIEQRSFDYDILHDEPATQVAALIAGFPRV